MALVLDRADEMERLYKQDSPYEYDRTPVWFSVYTGTFESACASEGFEFVDGAWKLDIVEPTLGTIKNHRYIRGRLIGHIYPRKDYAVPDPESFALQYHAIEVVVLELSHGVCVVLHYDLPKEAFEPEFPIEQFLGSFHRAN